MIRWLIYVFTWSLFTSRLSLVLCRAEPVQVSRPPVSLPGGPHSRLLLGTRTDGAQPEFTSDSGQRVPSSVSWEGVVLGHFKLPGRRAAPPSASYHLQCGAWHPGEKDGDPHLDLDRRTVSPINTSQFGREGRLG